MLLRIDRWWPQQLQPTTQHLVYAIRSHCYSPHRAEESSAADQVPPSSGGGEGRGAVGIQRVGFGGPVEERSSGARRGRLYSQAGVLDAGRSARALRSRPRLVRPFPGLPAPPWRLRVPTCRPSCTLLACDGPPGWFLCPGEWERLARIAQTSCTRRSRGRSPGAQSTVATTVHQRRLGQEEGDFRQGSLR